MEMVLADEYYADVETERFWVATLRIAKSASSVLKSLRDVLPLRKALQHLKRIRRVDSDNGGHSLQIVLASVSELGASTCEQCQESLESLQISCEVFSDFLTVSVPVKAPLTLDQWNVANRCWPCSWHEDKKMTKIREGNLFSSSEQKYISRCMQVAIEVAQHAQTHGKPAIGAVIADPIQQGVLALGTDGTSAASQPLASSHALKHTVMVCIDDLARQHGGGAWAQDVCCGHFQTFRKSVADDNESSDPPPPTPYLCTGYDMFVTLEPCVMCSMALVHSRIGRVFYGVPYPGHGGLGTAFKIHCQPGINHHFDVFRGLHGDQCQHLR